MRWVVECCLVVLVATPRIAAADATPTNALVGPVIGWRLGGPPGGRLILGVEGGVGWGPERINVGHTRRLGHGFTYVELDPWLFVGGTLGVGVDSEGALFPVLGVWEALPIVGGEGNRHCDALPDEWHAAVIVSVGYRYTGVHELYTSLKGGAMDGYFCLD